MKEAARSVEIQNLRAVGVLSAAPQTLLEPNKINVVNFWAPWCGPCQKELPVLAQLSQKRSDVNFVMLSVETGDKAAVSDMLKKWPLDKITQLFADEVVLQNFFGSDGEMPLPATFVFDGLGQMQRAFFRAVDLTDLAPLLNNLVEEAPQAEYLVRLAEHHALLGEIEASQSFIKRALRTPPRSSYLLSMLGNAMSIIGQYEEAIPYLQESVRLVPEASYPHYILGVAYKNTNQIQKALWHFKKANQLNPSDSSYLASLGAAYHLAGQNEASYGVFNELVRLEPNDSKAWLNWGKASLLIGRPDGYKGFERALELDPQNKEARALRDKYGP